MREQATVGILWGALVAMAPTAATAAQGPVLDGAELASALVDRGPTHDAAVMAAEVRGGTDLPRPPAAERADDGPSRDPAADAEAMAQRVRGGDPGADGEAFAITVGHAMRMRATERWARQIRHRGYEGREAPDVDTEEPWSVVDRGSYAVVEVRGLQTRELHPLGVGRKLIIAMDRGPKRRRAEWTGDATIRRLQLRGAIVPRLVLEVRHDAKWARRIADESMVVPTDDGFRVLVPRRHALANHAWPEPPKPTLQDWLADR